MTAPVYEYCPSTTNCSVYEEVLYPFLGVGVIPYDSSLRRCLL